MKPFRFHDRGPLDDAGFAAILTALAVAIGLIASGVSEASQAGESSLASGASAVPVASASPGAAQPAAIRLAPVEIVGRRS